MEYKCCCFFNGYCKADRWHPQTFAQHVSQYHGVHIRLAQLGDDHTHSRWVCKECTNKIGQYKRFWGDRALTDHLRDVHGITFVLCQTKEYYNTLEEKHASMKKVRMRWAKDSICSIITMLPVMREITNSSKGFLETSVKEVRTWTRMCTELDVDIIIKVLQYAWNI